MKTFKQFYTENLNRFENMDDLIFGVMDLIYSAGDYEANLRPVGVVDYGIKETQQMIDDYLTGVGLTDTQPEWYQQRFDIYKQLDDDVVRSSKDPDNLPEEPDGEWKTEEEYKEEMEDHHELYARFRAMVLAAMHNKSWKEYTNEYNDDHILNSTRRQNDVWKASERMRDGFGINEGLWANINAKKKRGGKSAKKGSKAYKAAKKAGDKLEVTKESVWKPGDLGVWNWGEYEAGGRHAELGAIEPHMEKIPGPDRVVAHMNGLQNEYMRVLKSRKSNPDVKDNYKYVRDNIDQAIQMMNQTTGRKTESGRNITQDIYIAGFAARRYTRAIESSETNQAYYKRLLNHLRDAADAMEGLIEQEAEGELGGWNVNENFKDGKKKGKSRPGRVKKAGTSCNGSVTELRKRAKNSSGEKAKMSHWCANMKSGKKKN